jgi:uncharacterized protein
MNPNPGYGNAADTGENPELWSAQPFVPRGGLRGPHRQTVASYFLPRPDSLPSPERRLFEVEDGSKVLCLCHWQPDRVRALSVVVVHGLEGSSESQYVIGTADKLCLSGANVVRMNVRNCGNTESLCRTLYHSGLSSDIDLVVRKLISDEGLQRIALVGFSMGGNQVLKLAGEWGAEAPPEVVAVAAVSPAMNLSSSADALHLPSNRLYEWKFLLSLRQRLKRKMKLFPDLLKVDRWWWRCIRDFDDVVTARYFGFRDAEDYYQQASASRVLERISVPTLVIHANDDPFIRIDDATRLKLAANPCIRFLETEHGGHCAFLAAADGYDGRWSERMVVDFLAFRANKERQPAQDVFRGK